MFGPLYNVSQIMSASAQRSAVVDLKNVQNVPFALNNSDCGHDQYCSMNRCRSSYIGNFCSLPLHCGAPGECCRTGKCLNCALQESTVV